MPAQKTQGQDRNMVSRSNSFLGTIKSILPTKWFGSSDQTDTLTKRKQAEERPEVEEGTRSTKRQRVEDETLREGRRASAGGQSRAPPAQPAYLDPPSNVFPGKAAVRQPRASPMHARASSVATPSRYQREPSKTRIASTSGLGAVSQVNRISRTQSMDPPTRYRTPSYKPALTPIPMTRDVSMEDLSFPEAEPPSPQRPFRMRTSMTPQLPDAVFGPAPVRKERDASEPPPLNALIENPVFVKAPSEAPRQATPMARQSSLTLGVVAEAQKAVLPIQRSRSSLMIGSDSSMQDIQTTQPTDVVAINAAEKALRELDVYKTPLLPTRLRGSNTVPDMFKRKRVNALTLLKDREEKPRLGMADKTGVREKTPEEAQSSKPYAGRGGMKKLLERRKKEEKEEAATSSPETATRTDAQDLGAKLAAELNTTPVKEPPKLEPPTSIGGREQSSLRVGRTRINRNHLVRPKVRAQPGRFSALYEEDEDEAMDDGSREKAQLPDPPAKPPSFHIPAGFSFAKETAPLEFDSTNAKEPPISSLPFSLTKSSAPPPTAGPSVLFGGVATQKDASAGTSPFGPSAQTKEASMPPVTVAAASQTISAPAPPTPILSAVPAIALIPPTPLASATQSATDHLASSTSNKPAIPNFFATSSLLSKSSSPLTSSAFSLTPSTSGAGTTGATSLFAPPKRDVVPPSVEPSSSESGSLKGVAPAATEKLATAAPLLNFSGLPSTSAPVSAFPVPSTTLATSPPAVEPAKPKDIPAPASTLPPSTPSPFGFGAPSAFGDKASEAPSTSFKFGAPSVTKPAEAAVSAPAPSLFGAPAPKSVELTPSPAPFTFGAPAKAESTANEAESRPSTGDASKPGVSLFGAAPVAPQPVTPFAGFGAPVPPSTPEPPKSAFTFGQPTASAPVSAPATPVPEAPKPLFGGSSGFNFGQPSTPSAVTPTKSPFQFGAAPATPTAENKPFAFGSGAPSTPTGSALFGGVTNGTGATPESKPFTFGTPTNQREVTPPKKDDSEVMMDESPSRGSGMDLNGKPELPKLNGGFAFNLQSGSSPFGQNTQPSTGFSFGSGQPSSSTLFESKPEVKAPEKPSTPFSFGQSSAPSTSSGFAFGQKPAEPAPATGFSFNSPATPTAPTAPFGFGAPQISQSNSFGQPASATTPASPSPFGQTPNSGFTFGGTPTPTTAAAPSNPFSFSGSQPASPATANAGLPQQNGFNFGASVAPTTTPSSPFGASAALPAEPPLFTMGAAPTPQNGGGARVFKKLPRRGGKR